VIGATIWLAVGALAALGPAEATKPTPDRSLFKPDTTFDEPPRVITKVGAIFPRPWDLRRGEGTVLVNVVVDSTGQVSRAKVALSWPAEIESVLVRAARRWTFSAARKRGRPV